MSKTNINLDNMGNELDKIINNEFNRAAKAVATKADEKAEKIREYRAEASRLASMANKRLKRLENAGLIDSPAYKKWLESGGEKFGVRGKTYNEVQKEVARMKKFIDSQTSTIRGVNSQLKEMAQNTGIKYSSLKDLRSKAGKFFELASKVEQYLRTVDDMASAIGYQKIWQAINKYVQKNKTDLASSKTNIDSMVSEVTKAMNVFDERIEMSGTEYTGWFKLPKD